MEADQAREMVLEMESWSSDEEVKEPSPSSRRRRARYYSFIPDPRPVRGSIFVSSEMETFTYIGGISFQSRPRSPLKVRMRHPDEWKKVRFIHIFFLLLLLFFFLISTNIYLFVFSW